MDAEEPNRIEEPDSGVARPQPSPQETISDAERYSIHEGDVSSEPPHESSADFLRLNSDPVSPIGDAHHCHDDGCDR
jgi:hypothetical protein